MRVEWGVMLGCDGGAQLMQVTKTMLSARVVVFACEPPPMAIDGVADGVDISERFEGRERRYKLQRQVRTTRGRVWVFEEEA